MLERGRGQAIREHCEKNADICNAFNNKDIKAKSVAMFSRKAKEILSYWIIVITLISGFKNKFSDFCP